MAEQLTEDIDLHQRPPDVTCALCWGWGRITLFVRARQVTRRCPACKGKGRVPRLATTGPVPSLALRLNTRPA